MEFKKERVLGSWERAPDLVLGKSHCGSKGEDQKGKEENYGGVSSVLPQGNFRV